MKIYLDLTHSKAYYAVVDRHVFNQFSKEWLTFRMASTNRWLLQSVFEKSVILKKIGICSEVRSVFLKIVCRIWTGQIVSNSILLLFSWSLNIRKNEKDSFASIYECMDSNEIYCNRCPVFRLAFSVLKGGNWKSVENGRENCPLLPVFVHAQWGKSKRQWDPVIKAHVVLH